MFVCSNCGQRGDTPHGCECGGEMVPTGPLPAEEPVVKFREGPPQVFTPLLDGSRPQTDLSCISYTRNDGYPPAQYPESFDADEEFD